MKFIVIVLTLLFLGSVCFGIDVYLGITQGFNIGMQYLSESDYNHYGAIVGFNGGFQSNIMINNLIGIEVDLLVSIRGGRMKDSDLSEEFKLIYIDLPILLKLNKNVGWGILTLNAGAQVSFNLKGYRLLEDNGSNQSMDNVNTRIVDFGVVAGAGLIFPVRQYYFSFEFRNAFMVLPTFAEVSNRNTQFSFLFTYGFRL